MNSFPSGITSSNFHESVITYFLTITKMKGYVAVQRKLLALIYTIYKTDKEYNPNFETEKKEKMEQSKKENIQNSVTDFLYYQIDNAIKSL